MDQNIEKSIYVNRINATYNEFMGNVKNTTGTNFIGPNNYSFFKGEDGKLHQVINERNANLIRAREFVVGKIKEQGLVSSNVVASSVAAIETCEVGVAEDFIR